MREFSITGLPVGVLGHTVGISDAALAGIGMRRVVVDETPGYPCRVSLVDAHVGETVILGTYPHHAVAGPYAAAGPIFVRECATRSRKCRNELPPVLRSRLLSVRGYEAGGNLLLADVVAGDDLQDFVQRQCGLEVAYLQVHNARPGCFLCQIDLL